MKADNFPQPEGEVLSYWSLPAQIFPFFLVSIWLMGVGIWGQIYANLLKKEVKKFFKTHSKYLNLISSHCIFFFLLEEFPGFGVI